MKNLRNLFGILMIGAVIFTGCKKEEDTTTPPEITNIQVGDHDGATIEVKRGRIASVEFDTKTLCEGKLSYYHLEMHDHPESGLINDEYRIIDEDFKANFEGLKNAHVHHHVAVPDTAILGEYHVVIVVVDEYGNSTDTENDDFHIRVVD